MPTVVATAIIKKALELSAYERAGLDDEQGACDNWDLPIHIGDRRQHGAAIKAA